MSARAFARCPPPEWRGAETREDPRGAEKCGEDMRGEEARGAEKRCGAEEAGDAKCWDDPRGSGKYDMGAELRAYGAASRKFESIRWGVGVE